MALAKIDPKKIFKTCSTLDPAIDHSATGEENIKNFEESYDMSFLKFKEGEYPTIFHIQNILAEEEAKIKQDHTKIEFPEIENKTTDELKNMAIGKITPKIRQVKTQEMVIKYFNCGVVQAEENGIVFPCQANTFGYIIVQEIGSFIMMRTQLGDNLKNVLKS